MQTWLRILKYNVLLTLGTLTVLLSVPCLASAATNTPSAAPEGPSCGEVLGMTDKDLRSGLLNLVRHRLMRSVTGLSQAERNKLDAETTFAIDFAIQNPRAYEQAAQAFRKNVKAGNAQSDLLNLAIEAPGERAHDLDSDLHRRVHSLWHEVAFFLSLRVSGSKAKIVLMNSAKSIFDSMSTDTTAAFNISNVINNVRKHLDADIVLNDYESSAVSVMATLMALDSVSIPVETRIKSKVATILLVDKIADNQPAIYDPWTSRLTLSVSADPIEINTHVSKVLEVNFRETLVGRQLDTMMDQIGKQTGIQILLIGDIMGASNPGMLMVDNYVAVGQLWHSTNALMEMKHMAIRQIYVAGNSWSRTNGIQDGKVLLTLTEIYNITSTLKYLKSLR